MTESPPTDPAPGAAKPKLLVVHDTNANDFVLLIADRVDVVLVTDWKQFDKLLEGDLSGFALAVVMPLTKIPWRERPYLFGQIARLREKLGDKPIFGYQSLERLHGDLLKGGYTTIVRRPREVEGLIAKHLGFTDYRYTPSPTPSDRDRKAREHARALASPATVAAPPVAATPFGSAPPKKGK